MTMDEVAIERIKELELLLEHEKEKNKALLLEHIALRQVLCLMRADREYSDSSLSQPPLH